MIRAFAERICFTRFQPKSQLPLARKHMLLETTQWPAIAEGLGVLEIHHLDRR